MLLIVEWAVGNSVFVSVNGVKVVGVKIGFILLSLLIVWCDDKIMMSVISPQYFCPQTPTISLVRDVHVQNST